MKLSPSFPWLPNPTLFFFLRAQTHKLLLRCMLIFVVLYFNDFGATISFYKTKKITFLYYPAVSLETVAKVI